MIVLGFERSGKLIAGRQIRESCFETRSALPVSAACLIANAARETLGAVFGTPVQLRLLEPRIPDRRAWNAITDGALLFLIRSHGADAAFVLRLPDALALTSAAFGESVAQSRELSSIESEVLTRTVKALTPCLGPIFGTRQTSAPERIASLEHFTTYFELLVEAPAVARIGIALSRDPQTAPSAELRIEELLDLEVDLRVELPCGISTAASLAALRAGSVLPILFDGFADVQLGGRRIARAECGIIGGRRTAIVS